MAGQNCFDSAIVNNAFVRPSVSLSVRPHTRFKVSTCVLQVLYGTMFLFSFLWPNFVALSLAVPYTANERVKEGFRHPPRDDTPLPIFGM